MPSFAGVLKALWLLTRLRELAEATDTATADIDVISCGKRVIHYWLLR
jgi:hypothetical protein